MSKNRTKKTIKEARRQAGPSLKVKTKSSVEQPWVADTKQFTNTGPVDFSVPWDIDPLSTVFPVNTPSRMPLMKDIPEDAKYGRGEYAKWFKLFGEWFYCGLSRLELEPRDGIDEKKAIIHVRSIMPSFDTKHEHKEAACVYLLHKWFIDAEWEINKKRQVELSK